MSNFDLALKIVNGMVEGGSKVSNDANDPGGQTKYGVIQDDINEYRETVDSSFPNITPAQLTSDQAYAIVKALYWDKLNLSLVTNPMIAVIIYGSGLNCGRETAVMWVQKNLNTARATNPPLVMDGKLGPVTAQAINNLLLFQVDWFLKNLVADRRVYYKLVVGNKPEMFEDLYGWNNAIDTEINPANYGG